MNGGRTLVALLLAVVLALFVLMAAARQGHAQPVDGEVAPQPVPRLFVPLAAKDAVTIASPTPTPPRGDWPHTGGSLAGLTVWGGGDSTAYLMNLVIAATVEDEGGTAPAPYYGLSQGLVNQSPKYLDAIRSAVAAYDPDVMVLMIGANDWGISNFALYEDLVAEAMDAAVAPGRLVVWVGMPAMGPDYMAAMPRFNEIFREQVALRPNVIYVDLWPLTTEGGVYTSRIPGTDILARTSDGIHFTSEGGRYLAAAVMGVIREALQ